MTKKRNQIACAVSICMMIWALMACSPLVAHISALAETASTQALESPDLDEVYYQYILKRAQMLHELGEYRAWSIEDKAALDHILVEGGWMEGDNAVINSIPNQEDVSQAEARRIAEETIVREFGVPQAELTQWLVEYTFYRVPVNAEWILLFLPKERPLDAPYDMYRVQIKSPSGEVFFFWKEQGDDGIYGEGVDELPGPNDISEEEAVQIARQAVFDTCAEEHRLTEEVFRDFWAIGGFIPNHEWGRIWIVSVTPSDEIIYNFFGSYNVYVSSETGEVLEISDHANG